MPEELALSVQEQKDVQLVEQGIKLFESVPQLVEENRTSRMRAEFATNKFLDKIEALKENANGAYPFSEELDKEANDLIVKIKTTIEKMDDKRKPFTQITSAIAKIFTGMEGDVKGLITKIQPLRDGWATHVAQEAARKQREAAEKAAIDTAKANLKGWVVGKIGEIANGLVFAKKERWNAAFNGITLENFKAKSDSLFGAGTTLSQADLSIALVFELPYIAKLDEPTKAAVKTEAIESYDYIGWIEKAELQLKEHKQALIDRLPSKRQELEEAAEAAKQAEEARKQQEAAAKKLAAEADENKRKELQRQQEIAAENARIAEENRLANEKLKAEREEAERQRLAEEQEKANREAKEQGDIVTAGAVAQSLFDQAVEATPDVKAGETRSGWEVTITHHSALAQIFQYWFNGKGINMSLEECQKTSINQMIKFVEQQRKDDPNNFIDSKYIIYTPVVKAVNRKTGK